MTAAEAAAFLRAVDDGKIRGLPSNETEWVTSWHENVTLEFDGGWKIVVFKDGGGCLCDLDYIDTITDPSGQEYSPRLFCAADEDPHEFWKTDDGYLANWMPPNDDRLGIPHTRKDCVR